MGSPDGSMPRLLPENTWRADAALRALLGSWLRPETLAWAEPELIDMGRAAVNELQAWGDACERQPALLRQFDGWGNRVDEVLYPPAWRELAYLCPVAMTDGAARVLADYEGGPAAKDALRHLISRDPASAWTSGQWMTERQGGSDVGLNAVVARRDGDHSNVGCEIALALARPEQAPPGTRGLALFLVPRDHPDGRRNDYRIDRLKDKLGTRAMATGEVTLDGASAELVGEAERGFAQMTAMLNITRLHNAVTAAAIMRRAVMLASAYAAHREAFGRKLDQHPLHQEILRAMTAQADGALHLTMRMAQLLGRIETKEATSGEAAVFRLGIALTKLYTAKQAVAVVSEALECFGGQGYMEDTGLPRLFRDAQVLPIWEGTTSVLALDSLRVLRRAETLDCLSAELERLDAPDRRRVLDEAHQAIRGDPNPLSGRHGGWRSGWQRPG
ncbi:MAG: acyl-CoA dehydrogenase [Chloroflexi bacterium]|nr:MAG: acyl-CoA dehydrogenase [Chloroflexota bacterium]